MILQSKMFHSRSVSSKRGKNVTQFSLSKKIYYVSLLISFSPGNFPIIFHPFLFFDPHADLSKNKFAFFNVRFPEKFASGKNDFAAVRLRYPYLFFAEKATLLMYKKKSNGLRTNRSFKGLNLFRYQIFDVDCLQIRIDLSAI